MSVITGRYWIHAVLMEIGEESHMKNIIKIFLSDIRGLAKNFFALVIAIGLCILPCLYAWFNIYSNWNPYANTSSIKIAVASEDKDYKLEDGTNVNMGDEVIKQLKENESIGWVFTDKKDVCGLS